MHLITLSLVTAVLIFHEKYEKNADNNKTGPRLKQKPGGKKQ